MRKTNGILALFLFTAFCLGWAANDYYGDEIDPRSQVAANGCETLAVVRPPPATEATEQIPAPKVQPKAVVAPAALEQRDWRIGVVLESKSGNCAWLRKLNDRWIATRLPPGGENMSFETEQEARDFLRSGWCN